MLPDHRAGQSSAQPRPGRLAESRPAGVEGPRRLCRESSPGLECLPGGAREERRWPALERGILFILPEIALLGRPRAAGLGRGTGGCSHLSLPAATSPAPKRCPHGTDTHGRGPGAPSPAPCRAAPSLGPSTLLGGEGWSQTPNTSLRIVRTSAGVQPPPHTHPSTRGSTGGRLWAAAGGCWGWGLPCAGLTPPRMPPTCQPFPSEHVS